MENSLQKSNGKKLRFSVAIQDDKYKELINSTLNDKKRALSFIANITSVVGNNPKLNECNAGSVLTAGLTAESLNLPLNQNLGFAYIFPFGEKATFIMGYKGYIQLALRSGQYRSLNVMPVFDGEYVGRDEFTGDPKFSFKSDDSEENDATPIGYMASFELINGFRKIIYWSHKKMEAHGHKYSKSYNSFWGKDNTSFNNQALKTMIRQLISKWGIMSVELQKAFETDMSVQENGTVNYIDNPSEPAPTIIPAETPVQKEEQPIIEQTDFDIESLNK